MKHISIKMINPNIIIIRWWELIMEKKKVAYQNLLKVKGLKYTDDL